MYLIICLIESSLVRSLICARRSLTSKSEELEELKRSSSRRKIMRSAGIQPDEDM
eukprot:Awhi_evm1s14823